MRFCFDAPKSCSHRMREGIAFGHWMTFRIHRCHRPRLDSTGMHPREGHRNQRTLQTNVFRGSGVRFLAEVSQTLRNHWEYIQEGKRAGGRTTRHSTSSYHHRPYLHLLPSPSLDTGKYTVPPHVGNLDRRLLTTPVKHRLLLESGRNVSPTGQGSLNQEKTFVACVRNHPNTKKRLTR